MLLRAIRHFNLNANSLTWDHHPHSLLRSSISAQAGTFSPCLSQVIALQPGLCPHLLAASHVSCYSFPPGLHQLLSSAIPDQTTGWTLGLTDSFILSGPCDHHTVQILWDRAGVGKSTACVILLLAELPRSCCSLTNPSFKEPVMHPKKSLSSLLI